MMGRGVSGELERIWKETTVTQLKYYFGTQAYLS